MGPKNIQIILLKDLLNGTNCFAITMILSYQHTFRKLFLVVTSDSFEHLKNMELGIMRIEQVYLFCLFILLVSNEEAGGLGKPLKDIMHSEIQKNVKNVATKQLIFFC